MKLSAATFFTALFIAATGFTLATSVAKPVDASQAKCKYYTSKSKLSKFGSKYHQFCNKSSRTAFKKACDAAGREHKTNNKGKVRCKKAA